MPPPADLPGLPAGVRLEPVAPDDAAGRDTYLAVRNAIVPEQARDAVEHAHLTALTSWSRDVVARVDGEPAGVASVATQLVATASRTLWAELGVLPRFRHRGLGSALLADVSAAARARGFEALRITIDEREAEALAFLERRGFRESARDLPLVLPLDEAPDDPAAPPVGVRLTTLAAEPGLVAGVHAVALEAEPDIPRDDPMTPAGLEEWRRREVDAPWMRLEAFFVAVEGDRVVGYASLSFSSARPGVANHEMTGVARAARGRGLARALKLATIRWAREAGLQALETENDAANVPMRAVNARLGYRPRPALLTLVGSVDARLVRP